MPKNNAKISTPKLEKKSSDTLKSATYSIAKKSIILANFDIKCISFLVTIVLFAFVLTDRNITVTFDEIPIAIIPPDSYTMLGDPSIQSVTVSVKGRAKLARNLKREELGTLAINPIAMEGYAQSSINPNMLQLPEGLQVANFKPNVISYTLEKIASRTVQVSTDHAFTGELSPGFQLGEVTIKPSTIEIIGPHSLVSEVNQVFIEPVDLTGKAESFTVNRWIVPSRVGISTKSSPMVQVSVNIITKLKERTVLSVPIYPLNLTKNFSFTPPTADIVLTGDEDALNHLDPSRLFFAIDATQDELLPPHSRMIKLTSKLIQNLPPGVALNEAKLLTTLLQIHETPTTQNPSK